MSKKNAPMYAASVCDNDGDMSRIFAVSSDPQKLIKMIHAASGKVLESRSNPNNHSNTESSWTIGKKVNEYGDAIGYPCWSVDPILLVS